MRTWLGVFALVALLPAAMGEHRITPRLRIPRVTRAPRLADFLESRPREREAKLTDFRQREPRDGQAASKETTAYLSYDNKNLYVGFWCRDDRGQVRAQWSKRDNIFGDDLVSVALDTFLDHRRAYLFESNPLGVQADGIATEGQVSDFRFDTVWRSEGRITESGYVVLMTIPFSSIRFPKSGSGDWGIALTRVIPRASETSTWPHITSRVEGYVGQFAILEGIAREPAPVHVQLTPYGFLGSNTLSDGQTRQSRGEFRGGADAKLTFQQGLTLDLTANPDFSQVESDEPQVTLNQRFEVVYPERRPFFLDNASFFETPEALFFSRRIVSPELGAKLTGKVGKWGFGALFTDDRDGMEGAERRALAGVVRAQREFGRAFHVAGMAVTRARGTGSNTVVSTDLRWKLSPNWIFTGQLMRSETRTSNAQRTGTASFSEIRHAGRRLTYYTNFRTRSPEFEAALGYMPRTDIRYLKNAIGYRWWPERGPLLGFGPAFFNIVNYDHSGQLQDWSMNTPFYWDFRGPVSFAADAGESFERYRGAGLRKNYRSVWASVERWRWVTISGSWQGGAAVNYYPVGGRAPFTGAARDGALDVTVRPTARLRLDESYLYTRLATGGQAVYASHIARGKVNYQFSRALSLRLIVDYRTTAANRALIDVDTGTSVRSDFLLTYMVNHGTVLYAGYGNARHTFGLDDMMLAGERPAAARGRQLFVKLSYMIRH